jgi:tetratricopeptide (TPR) repeat protein
MRMKRSVSALAVVAALVLTAVADRPASAAGQARAYGTVTDENKTPLAGVKITIVNTAVSNIRLEAQTDAAGKWAITLVDATKSHHYRFEKEGYQPMEMDLKLPIGSNERHDVTLKSAAAVVAEAGAGESTPANNAAVMYNEGVEALRMGDSVTAITKIKGALEHDPELLAAHEALGIVYAQEKRYAEAAAEAEFVLAKDPQNEKAIRVAVDSYKNLGNKEKLATYQALLAGIDPVAAAADLYNQGVNAYNAGEMKKALPFFQQAAEKNPDFAKTYYMIAMCYAGDSKNAQAKEFMEKFIAMAPADDPDVATAKEMLPYLK